MHCAIKVEEEPTRSILQVVPTWWSPWWWWM